MQSVRGRKNQTFTDKNRQSMDHSKTNIVPRAISAYNRGDYQTAKALYQEAARRYGESLFSANLQLCQKALRNDEASMENTAAGNFAVTTSEGDSPGDDATSAVSRQLAETQTLLEKYYSRCQELEHQLMDRQKDRETT